MADNYVSEYHRIFMHIVFRAWAQKRAVNTGTPQEPRYLAGIHRPLRRTPGPARRLLPGCVLPTRDEPGTDPACAVRLGLMSGSGLIQPRCISLRMYQTDLRELLKGAMPHTYARCV